MPRSSTHPPLGHGDALLGLVLSSFLNAGCPKKATVPNSRPANISDPVAQDTTNREESPRLRVTLAVLPEQDAVRVRIRANGAPSDLKRWTLASSVQHTPVMFSFSDCAGEAQVHNVEPGADTKELLLPKAPDQELTLEYSIPLSSFTSSHRAASGLVFRASELLAYPSNWSQQSFALKLDLEDARESSSIATSQGPWSMSQKLPGTHALRSWAALVGTVQRARFEDPLGRRDSFAVIGRFPFDSRWLAAEVASVRSAVDTYFASPHQSEHNTLFYATKPSAQGSGLAIEETNAGLLLGLEENFSWDSPHRITLTQFLVRKKLVGLWDFSTAASRHWSKAAFEQGCARQIARSILFDQGILSAQEYADDLNSLQSASLDPLRPEAATLAQAISSGAAMCKRLDVTMKKRSSEPSALRYWIYDMRIRREQSKESLALSKSDFPFAEKTMVALWDKVMVQGQPVSPSNQDLSPCLHTSTGSYTFYDVGPTEAMPGQELGPLSSFAKDKVGLRPDDKFVKWTLDDPVEPKSVNLQTDRDGTRINFEFTPQVIRKQGPRYERLPKVPDAACHF